MEHAFTPQTIALSLRSVAEQPLGVLVLEVSAFLILGLVFVSDLKERHNLLVTVLVCSIVLSLPVGLYEARLKKLESNSLPHPVNWYEQRIQYLEEKLSRLEQQNERILSRLDQGCNTPKVINGNESKGFVLKFSQNFLGDPKPYKKGNSSFYHSVTELE